MAMRSKELRTASLFAILYAIAASVYTYVLLFADYNSQFIIFSLPILTILIIIVFLYLKRFLKYYYNYKDKENFVFFIILFEIFHSLFMIIFIHRLHKSDDYYFVYSSYVALIVAVLIAFYIVFSVKLYRIGSKYTRFMKLFSVLFIVVTIYIIFSFLFSLLTEQSLLNSFDYNSSSYMLPSLKDEWVQP